MPGAYKRDSDKARGRMGKWTIWWVDEHGQKRSKVGYTDKANSLELARSLETEAKRIRDGLVDPAERQRREASLRPVQEHIDEYRSNLLAKGDGVKHANHIAGAIARLFKAAAIASVSEIAPAKVQDALGRMKSRRSARTCNHALRSVQAFAKWLFHDGRIQEVPRGLATIPLYPEGDDRKYVRRAMSKPQLERLLEATRAGKAIVAKRDRRTHRALATLTGPERAWVYSLAMATGFRASEIASLTPEQFRLDGDSPSVTVLAAYSKRGKRSGRDDVQPIRREDARLLAPLLEGRERGRPVVALPEKTAEMLAADLAAAGIEPVDDKGRVIDFHSLRHSYITHLVASGVNPKIVQKLARHSTITLTLDRYTHVEDADLRGALEAPGEFQSFQRRPEADLPCNCPRCRPLRSLGRLRLPPAPSPLGLGCDPLELPPQPLVLRHEPDE